MNTCSKWPGNSGDKKPKPKNFCGRSYTTSNSELNSEGNIRYSYVVDFYCHSHRLVIAVDGPVHSDKEAEFNDGVRSNAFKEFNIEVMRFSNDEVLFETAMVLQKSNSI